MPQYQPEVIVGLPFDKFVIDLSLRLYHNDSLYSIKFTRIISKDGDYCKHASF